MKVKVVVPSNGEICKKGNGRIFVQTKEEVTKVEQILKEYDEGEFEGYYPNDFVAEFDKTGKNNKLIYTGKFDIKEINKFIAECQKQDIYVIIYSCNEYSYDDFLTLETAVQRDLGIVMMSDFVFNKTKDW